LTTNKKPRGTPFQKGHDPRRNLKGGSSPKAKQELKAAFKEIFEEEATPGRLRRIVRTLFRKAEAGQPWAISEVLDRGLGKPAQSIGVKDETPRPISIVYLKRSLDNLKRADGILPGFQSDAGSRALPESAGQGDGIIDAPEVAGPAKGAVTLLMPRPGWDVGQDDAPVPGARPVASLTDAELDAEIAQLEAKGGEDEPAA